MKRIAAPWILVLLVLAAPVLAADPAPGADETAILSVLRAAEAGWNAGTVQAYMDAYWKSEDLRFASGSTVTYGWQPVLERYLSRYPDANAMGKLIFEDLEVTPAGPDHAVVFGTWRLVRGAAEPHGLFTLVFRRLPEGWRIIADHTSSAGE
jgi:hypothetical protein